MIRNTNIQTVAWLWDLYQRKLINLEPPYQRQSVWNLQYREDFIDTVLNNYPAPAIFLHQEITDDGVARYSVVDGKQRLLTVFSFIGNEFPVGEKATISRLRGLYFKDLDPTTKTEFWRYQFLVEYITSTDEKLINNIFDRINRNVVKLTAQELRHARMDGEFISDAEALTEWMRETLPGKFPTHTARAKAQMKDVEFVAQLLLMIDEGVRSYSQADLDIAFLERDQVWEHRIETVERFKDIIKFVKNLVDSESGSPLLKTRFKNQADFYSLFGAIGEELQNQGQLDIVTTAERLLNFIGAVEAGDWTAPYTLDYFEAARSASNDVGPRQRRIAILRNVIVGNTMP